MKRSVLSTVIWTCAAWAAFSPWASAGYYDSPEELWERYCKSVGLRDETEVLACYSESLREQLMADKTAGGRARLGVHMGDLYEMLFRDYDYEVADQKEQGANKVIFTIKFKHRKKPEEHTATVEFVSDDERWFVSKTPELQDFLKAGSGTVSMIAGVAAAIVVIGLLLKKALG